MRPARKAAQLQIRVTPAEKDAIQRAARGEDEYVGHVLARALPAGRIRFEALTGACRDREQARFALAELNDWLAALGAGELREALASAPQGLAPDLANYVAAMVEYACGRRGVPPPAWTRTIAPLAEPMFGSELLSLRLYLLSHSPAPFRRRNIFVDASVHSRV